MAVTPKTITGTLLYPDGTAAAGAKVEISVKSASVVTGENALIGLSKIRVTADENGLWSADVVPSEDLTGATKYVFEFIFPRGGVRVRAERTVTGADPINFEDLV